MNMEVAAINASTQEKFHAAVELIKNLPRSGSFQPTNELRLKFYSYFKQATEGPCELPRPGFWDIVNRAKWDAWSKLGNMSKEEAMSNYVKEFVSILEETPLDDPTVLDDYIHIMGPYIHYAPKEYREKTLMNGKAKLIGNMPEENARQNNALSGKPLKGHKSDPSDDDDDVDDNYPTAVNGHSMNGSNESDSEEFSDTLERVDGSDTEDTLKDSITSVSHNNPVSEVKGSNIINVRGGGEQRVGAGDSCSPAGTSAGRGNRASRQARSSDVPSQVFSNNNISGSGGSRRSGGNIPAELSADVNGQLAMAIIRLQHVMEKVVVRMDNLETLLLQRQANATPLEVARQRSSWSFLGISPKAALIILAWPFIVQWLIYIIRKRNRRL